MYHDYFCPKLAMDASLEKGGGGDYAKLSLAVELVRMEIQYLIETRQVGLAGILHADNALAFQPAEADQPLSSFLEKMGIYSRMESGILKIKPKRHGPKWDENSSQVLEVTNLDLSENLCS